MTEYIRRGRFLSNDNETIWVDCMTINTVFIDKRNHPDPEWEIIVRSGSQEIPIKVKKIEDDARLAALSLLRLIGQVKKSESQNEKYDSEGMDVFSLKPRPEPKTS